MDHELESIATECNIARDLLEHNGIETLHDLFELPDVDVQKHLKLQGGPSWTLFTKRRSDYHNLKANPYNWSQEDVAKWLEKNDINSVVVKAFVAEKINGRGLLALTYDDLDSHLSVSLPNKRKLWACLENLKKEAPPRPVPPRDASAPEHEDDDPNEVISVPEVTQDCSDPSFVKHTNNWTRYKRSASRTNYSPRISFVGPTQCGKSHFLTELMDFKERVVQQMGPTTAAPGQEHPTTGNVNQYNGIVNNQRVILLDGEGADGRLPLKFLNRVKQKLISLVIPQDKFDEYNLKRTEYVSKKLPQLFYAVSNIIIFTNRQALANREYVTRIQQFASQSIENQQSRNLPYLIIIQNFANPQSELAEDPTQDPYDPKDSTKKFKDSIETENKECKDLLDSAFSGLCFLKIPDGRIAPTKYSDQIRKLKDIIEREIQKMRTNSSCYTLNPKNSFTDFMWYRVAERVIIALNNNMPVNISEIFFRVGVPNDSTKRNAALRLFHEIYQSMPEPAAETVPDYMESRIKRYKDARRLALEMYCLAICDDLKEHNLDDVTKENVRLVLLRGYFEHLLECYEDLRPCERHDKDGCCMQDRNVHACHTYENPTKRTSLLRFLLGKFKTFTYSSAELQFTDDSDHVKRFILGYLETIMKLSPEELFKKRMTVINSVPQGKLEYKFWEKNCGLCLAPYKPAKDSQENFEQHRLMIFDCNHYFCDKCVKSVKKIQCPFHKKEVHLIDDKAKVPPGAAPRVLSLDGGGVRGLVLLQMLQQLEKLTGAQINELFDYIIGTSVGGIVSLALGSGKSVADVTSLYTSMINKVFSANFFRQVFAFGVNARYSKTTLINELKKHFGDTNLANLAMTKAPRVAAVSSLESKQKTALFVSYTPACDKKKSYSYIFGFPLHFAAAASSAAPLYFNPVNNGSDIFVDGGIKANNPAEIGLQEATRLWSQPDVLVSLGTGLSEAQVTSSVSIRYWINRFIDLVTDSGAVDQRLEQHLSQAGSITEYVRFSPELRKTIPLDTVDKKMLEAMEQDTVTYIEKFNLRFMSTGRVLLSKLFYTSVSIENNRYKIRVHSRLDNKRTMEILAQQQVFKNPHLHLDVISSKAAGSYHSIYVNRTDTIENTPDGNLMHAQAIPFNFATPFGTFDFAIEKVRRSCFAVVCLTDNSLASSLRFPISGCPIKLEMHEDLLSSASASF